MKFNLKLKRLLLYGSISLVIVIIIIILASSRNDGTIYHKENSNLIVLNPDQGFYRTDYIKITPTDIDDKSDVLNDDFQLYHLRMDISAFSGKVNGNSDLNITQEVLGRIETFIKKFESKGKNIIMRFAYDPNFEGSQNTEPISEQTIINHIKQLCPILNKYSLTITAIEAGLIGPYGEMHSSQYANKETISKIIETFLLSTTTIPILVRTPIMIYGHYFNKTISELKTFTIPETSKAYRLGLFNDGYLGSDDDLGTYQNRETEIKWLSQQTNHLPFGGEVTAPNSILHNIEECLPEMFDINLSYLNYEWNDQVIKKWKNTKYDSNCKLGNDKIFQGKTAYEYIFNHMGYRFVLQKSKILFKKEQNLNYNIEIHLQIINKGFGQLNRVKQLQIVIVNKDNDEDIQKMNVGNYKGEEILLLHTQVVIVGKANYNVYLGIYSECDGGIECYQVRFANDLWNEKLKMNKIGEIKIQ